MNWWGGSREPQPEGGRAPSLRLPRLAQLDTPTVRGGHFYFGQTPDISTLF